MLDDLATEYEELITVKLEQFKTVVEEALNEANKTSARSNVYLAAIAKANGYAMENDVNLENIQEIINDKSEDIVDNATNNNTDNSGTENNSNTNNSNTNSSSTSTSTEIPAGNTTGSITPARIADNYISTHAKKIKNANGNYNKDEYSDVNKAIMKVYDGKALTTKQFKALSKLLGITYDNATKKGALYKKLKKIDAYGFKTGGIAELIKSQGEDGIAFVRNKEGLIAPEHVPMIQKLVYDSVPKMNDIANQIAQIPIDKSVGNVVEYGDISFVFELSGVTKPEEFLNEIQTNKKIQKAIQSISIDMLNGGGRLSVRNIK